MKFNRTAIDLFSFAISMNYQSEITRSKRRNFTVCTARVSPARLESPRIGNSPRELERLNFRAIRTNERGKKTR